MKNKEKKFLIKFFPKKFLIKKFRSNSIKAEGAKELAQGLKALINLNSITIDL